VKRASYRFGVKWIAANDNAGSPDTLADVAGYVSTLLLADLFAVEPDRVAKDVQRERQKLHKQNSQYCLVK
jgi:hypothetical protein